MPIICRRPPGSLVVLGLLAICSCAPDRDDEADPAEELRAIKAAIVDGHRTRDSISLDSLYPDDYVVIDSEGNQRGKADLLAGLKDGPDMLEGRYELRTIRRWGKVAVASGHGRMAYRSGDSTSIAEYNSVNVFERRDGRWRYVAAFVP